MNTGEQIADRMARSTIAKAITGGGYFSRPLPGPVSETYKARTGPVTFTAEWDATECALTTSWTFNGLPCSVSAAATQIEAHVKELCK